MKLIKLQIKGISYSQSHNGSYALILEEFKGIRKLPIIIGNYEAQSIALALESELITKRPITHDLFVSLSKSFNIYLKFIVIYKLEEEVFYSNLFFEDQNKQEKILDSRTSDAIALAIRFKSPIFTNNEVLNLAGITLNLKENFNSNNKSTDTKYSEKYEKEKKSEINIYETFTIQELKNKLNEVLENEDYEEAVLIRDELQKRIK